MSLYRPSGVNTVLSNPQPRITSSSHRCCQRFSTDSVYRQAGNTRQQRCCVVINVMSRAQRHRRNQLQVRRLRPCRRRCPSTRHATEVCGVLVVHRPVSITTVTSCVRGRSNEETSRLRWGVLLESLPDAGAPRGCRPPRDSWA